MTFFPTVASTLLTIAILVVYAGLVVGLVFLKKWKVGAKKKPLNFGIVVLIATALGILFGLALQYLVWPSLPDAAYAVNSSLEWLNAIGQMFISALKLMIVPLIVVSIIRSLLKAGSGKDSAKSGVRVIGMLVITVAISALIGYFMVGLFSINPSAFDITWGATGEANTIIGTIQSIVPSNLFSALSSTVILAVLFIALLFGFAMMTVKKELPEFGKKLDTCVEVCYEVVGTVLDFIIKVTPYCVLAIMTVNMATNGVKALLELAKFVPAFYVGLVLVVAMQFLCLIVSRIKLKNFVKCASTGWLAAFSFQSSMAAMPFASESLQKMGVKESTASMAASLGTCMGQNACAGLYPAMIATITALHSASGITNVWSVGFAVQIVLFCIIGSLGAAGVGGGNLQASMMVLSMMGLDFALLYVFYGLDYFIGILRPSINQNGSLVAGAIAQKLEDREERRKAKKAAKNTAGSQ